jgi:6-pyruvoyltetrahydropterin/6-carboxytetrahydropterin synthase
MITMTRRVMFSAAHSDWLPHLSPEENRALFGPSASPEPYGHNYLLDVSVTGEIDASTGILVNIKVLDRVVKEQIVQKLDRKWINRQIPAFYERPVTAATLTEYIVSELLPALPPEVALSALRLEQTPLHIAEWQAEEGEDCFMKPGEILLTRVYEFAASHRLHSLHLTDAENRELFGKCNYENGHGHNYVLEITVAGPIDPRSGQVIDSDKLDEIVNHEVVERYDHRHLNLDIPEFKDLIPSSELVTKIIWERLYPRFSAPVRLHRVVVRETARNFFEYRGEEHSG